MGQWSECWTRNARDARNLVSLRQADMNVAGMVQEWAADLRGIADFSQVDLDFGRMFRR